MALFGVEDGIIMTRCTLNIDQSLGEGKQFSKDNEDENNQSN